jgi:DNA-binding PadR family transcriptional regulator
MHPYEVAQTLRSRGKQESVRLNYGSLYAVVESLERRGLIRALETVRDGRRPERTVYKLTAAGTRELNEWLSELVSVPVKEFPQFMAALSFLGALPPDEAQEALSQRALALEFRLAQNRGGLQAATAAGLARLFWLESEYEDRLLEAELDFVRALIKDIDNGSLDGIDLWRAFESEGADDTGGEVPDTDQE